MPVLELELVIGQLGGFVGQLVAVVVVAAVAGASS